MATLTVEFHSVSTGPGLGCPHPNRRPRSIVAPPLTNGIHSVWRRRGSSDSHPNRRTRLIVCRHSPSKFTVLRVVAERAVRTRIDTLVRARAVTHHRNSQCFELSRIALSTPESTPAFERVPTLTVEIHSVLSVRGRRYLHPYRLSHSTAQRLAPRPDQHVDILPPNRLTTLCIRKVRATIAAAKQGCGGVDICCRHRLVALWISMVSVGIRLSCGPIEVWTSGT